MKKNIVYLWWGMCVIFPLIVVWLGSYVLSSLQSRPFCFRDEFWPRMGQCLLAAMPFIFLSLYSRNKLLVRQVESFNGVLWAGVGVLVFVSTVWGYYYYDAFLRRTGGANIGSGLLLLCSPLFSSLVMMVCYRLGRNIKGGVSP
jgi:hypothetical protein